MYSALTIRSLKEELKKRGASLRGRKADLIERLEYYDKNYNFGNIEIADEDEQMQLPENDGYRDINSDTSLPRVNKTIIRHYLSFTSKKMSIAEQLYETRHLVTVRSQTIGPHTYIKGICRKTMKNLHYEINIRLDEEGYIQETHCECPAGSGIAATCKHVAVVLLGVENMVSAKHMVLFETCTQRLQQFHVPKNSFSGTPLRAEKLPRKRTLSTIFEAYPINKIDKDNYNSRIRSIVLNYPGSSMPMKQLYKPANPYSLELDHCYTSTDPKAEILKDLMLSSIRKNQIDAIEESTRGQISSLEWHKQRQNRLTASNFHTICHLKKTTTKSFTKKNFEKREFQSRSTNHGIINEKVALNKYMEMNDLPTTPCGLFISQERPYLAASPDALLGTDTIIEIKCPYASRYHSITTVTVPYLTEINGNLELKETTPCYYQIQGQLYCSGRKFCNLLVYTFKDMKVIYVNRDEAFLKNMLMKLDTFFEKYLKEAIFEKYLYYNYENLFK